MSLPFISYVPINIRSQFIEELTEVANKLGANPEDLMIVMFKESGVSPSIENTHYYFDGANKGYATGLIQFTPDTAASLGTNVKTLKTLNHVQQLDYVYKYFRGAINQGYKLDSYFALYLYTFFPAAIPYINDNNWIFHARGISASEVAKGNKGLDLDHDGNITMGEFKKYLLTNLPPEVVEYVVNQQKKNSK